MKTIEIIMMNVVQVFGFAVLAILVISVIACAFTPFINMFYRVPKDAKKDSTLTKAQFDNVLDSIAAGRVVFCSQCGHDMKAETYNKDGQVILADYYCPHCGNYEYPISMR